MDKSIIIKYFHTSVRIFTGLLLIIIAGSKFGLLPSAVKNEGLFTPEGWAFISVIQTNGYLFPVIGIIFLLCGIALLINRYVALAALIIVPITINFALFHLFYAKTYLPIQLSDQNFD